MTKNQLLNIIVVNLVMGRSGILEHSPSYIEEKYSRYLGKGISDDESWKTGLHPTLRTKIQEYLDLWKKDISIIDREDNFKLLDN